MPTYHTAIIGAGASGLFCAGTFNASKIILDHNKLPCVKVSISGGGKCNFTNRTVTSADYLCTHKHFCKNALAAFTPANFMALLDREKIPYEQREHGQLFAYDAQDIVQFLVKRARQAHTEFSLNTQVLSVTKSGNFFVVCTSGGTCYAQHVVLATGGLSYPALGASCFGIQLASHLGLPLIQQRPALCGLTFPKELRARFASLAGNSTQATVRTGKYCFTDQLLFTHQGISGPAVLPISLYWKEEEPIRVDFFPQLDVEHVLRTHKQKNQKVSSLLALPGKITQTLLGSLDQPLANMTRQTFQQVLCTLKDFQFIPTGSAGYTKAEVTAGGVNTQAVNPSTFEVKEIPGLYIIGELLDVTGRLGGFNLHWAWASGFCAGQDLAKKF